MVLFIKNIKAFYSNKSLDILTNVTNNAIIYTLFQYK